MKKTKFIKILEEENIIFEEKNDKIIITNDNYDIELYLLKSLPEGIALIFNNGGNVNLQSLKTLPKDTVFNNGGCVNLKSLTYLPDGTVFNNGDVYLNLLEYFPEGTEFNNRGNIYLNKEIDKLPENVKFPSW